MQVLPTTRQLQFFQCVCDEKNYRRAAEKLGISQPALTAAIKELEAQLGGKLIDRTYRKQVVTTAAGASLLYGVRKILADCASLCEEVRREMNPDEWTVRLGIVPTIAPFLLPRLLPFLKKRIPHLHIRVMETTSAHIKTRMDQGDIDFALMAFPYDMPGYLQVPLFKERFVCAVPADNDPFKRNTTILPYQLEGQNILLLEDGHCLRNHAIDACHLSVTAEQEAMQASSLSTLIQMVAHGQGITLLPKMAKLFGNLPDSIRIKEFEDTGAPTRTIGCVWRKNSPHEEDYLTLNEAIHFSLIDMGYRFGAKK